MKRRMVPMLAAIVLAPLSANAADPAVPMAVEPYQWDSGVFENPGEKMIEAAPGMVSWSGTRWIRVHLGESNLGAASYVVLTSAFDGQEQALDAETLAAWSGVSAAFHGDAVTVALHVAPGEKGVFVRVTGVTVPLEQPGDPGDQPAPRTICGATDDRVAIVDNRVGRLPGSGCTGWLVSNGAVLTAGHCGVAVGHVLEFNVPASTANGNLVTANVNDQYPVTSVSTVVNGGAGNDYQVLGIGPNSMTKNRAHVVNGFFRMVNTTPANGATVRVTGFGVDNTPAGPGGPGAACCDSDNDSVCEFNCNSATQTEQTHAAAYSGLSGSTHQYVVDTMPANSGSPIIWEAFGVTIGIHTFGSCTSSGGTNGGTSFGLIGLRNAIRDFPGPLAIYVDGGVSGLPTNGGVFEPYNHVWQGVSAVQNGGIVSIVKGNYPASSGETFIAGGGFKAMTLEAPVGTVTIGN